MGKPLDKRTPGVTIRIRDRGGGISPSNYAKLWDYGFTTFNEDEINDKVPATAEETEQLKLKTERDEDIVKHSSDSAAASGAHNTVGVISNYDQGSVDFASGSNKPEVAGRANIKPLDKRTPGVTIRIRDRGGGISPANYAKLWDY